MGRTEAHRFSTSQGDAEALSAAQHKWDPEARTAVQKPFGSRGAAAVVQRTWLTPPAGSRLRVVQEGARLDVTIPPAHASGESLTRPC